MNKDKVSRALNVLFFCACGDEVQSLRRLKNKISVSEFVDYKYMENYLEISDDLQKEGITLVDVSKFLLAENWLTALKYLSILCELKLDKSTDLISDIYDSAFKSSSGDFRGRIKTELKASETIEDLICLYKIILISTPTCNLPNQIYDNLSFNNRILFDLLKRKRKPSNWFCSVKVKNNYSKLSRLLLEEKALVKALEEKI